MNRTTAGYAVILLWVAVSIGWVMNIIQLIQTADNGITGMYLLKIVGIFLAPLGALLGWIN